jgi:triphosphoribosyl-dephospho-CoA synthetase
MSPRAKKTTSMTVIPKPKLVRNRRCDSYDSICSTSTTSSLESMFEFLENCIDDSLDLSKPEPLTQ